MNIQNHLISFEDRILPGDHEILGLQRVARHEGDEIFRYARNMR